MNNILDNIPNEHQITVYVSIGSANNYDQQYPPCLKTITTPLYIILIDPELENPVKINKLEKNINIHCIRKNVDYDKWHPFFDKLNNYAIKNHWFVVVHDFSGNDIAYLAEKYDHKLQNHLSHIIYGIGVRQYGGCFMDLSNIECQFVYEIKDNITAFNPYIFDNSTNMLEYISTLSNNNNKQIIIAQIRTYLNNKVKKVEKNINLFRRITFNYLENRNIKINKSELNDKLHQYFENKDWYNMYVEMIIVLRSELESFFCKFNNNISESVINSMLDITDPYKWWNYVNTQMTNQIDHLFK